MTEPCRTIRELHRLLGKKTLETEILKEALEDATSQKQPPPPPPSRPKDGSRRRPSQS
jgi:transposase